MDVLLHQSSTFNLPSSRRVGAIVHDGATDLRVWPGPGRDRELAEGWGPGLQEALDNELEKTGESELPIGGMLRVQRGRLHCDFLLWIASRPPESEGIRSPAPSADVLHEAVLSALRFVAERNVVRVAIGNLGEGPEEVEPVKRLEVIARAANAYYDECFSTGKPPVLEEVLICDASSERVATARKSLGKAVKAVAASSGDGEEKPKKKRAATTKGTRRSSRSAPKLDEEEVSQARATASPYDRTLSYTSGDFFVHPKFGVGRVEEITPEGFIKVLFEGGDIRRMLHQRA